MHRSSGSRVRKSTFLDLRYVSGVKGRQTLSCFHCSNFLWHEQFPVDSLLQRAKLIGRQLGQGPNDFVQPCGICLTQGPETRCRERDCEHVIVLVVTSRPRLIYHNHGFFGCSGETFFSGVRVAAKRKKKKSKQRPEINLVVSGSSSSLGSESE